MIETQIVPWSSVVGQSVLLKDSETGHAVAQLSIRIHTDAAGDQDIKACAGHVAKHVEKAFHAYRAIGELREAATDYAKLVQVENFDRNDIAVHRAYERLRKAIG